MTGISGGYDDPVILRAAQVLYESMIHFDPHEDDEPWSGLTDREHCFYMELIEAVIPCLRGAI